MSRIQDFFSTEDAMEQLDWALHSPNGSSKRRADSTAMSPGVAITADEAWQKAMQKANLHAMGMPGESPGVPNELQGEQPSISGDPDGPPGMEEHSFNWQFRIGLPRNSPDEDAGGGEGREGDMRYLQIPEGDHRDRFHQFAKDLAAQLSIECADANPYIQALCAHRAELLKSSVDLVDEVVDSLPARLATQHEGLATLRHSRLEYPDTRMSCGILGPASSVMPLSGCRDHSETPRDLLVESDVRAQYVGCSRFNYDNLEPDVPVPYNSQRESLIGVASTSASTAASTGSNESEPPRTPPHRGIPQRQQSRKERLSLRTDSGKLKLGEEDKGDFLAMLDLDACDDNEAPPPHAGKPPA
jgi:hypothetical protein